MSTLPCQEDMRHVSSWQQYCNFTAIQQQRKESADIYQAQNRPDLYQIENEELQVIEAYLPQQMDRVTITEYIKDAIARTGAGSMKDMGKVMGIVNKELSGKADGKTISEVVKEILGYAFFCAFFCFCKKQCSFDGS